MGKKLAALGLETCAALRSAPLATLRRELGPKTGAAVLEAARGEDRRPWVARPPRKSVGAQVTWWGGASEWTRALESTTQFQSLIVEKDNSAFNFKT